MRRHDAPVTRPPVKSPCARWALPPRCKLPGLLAVFRVLRAGQRPQRHAVRVLQRAPLHMGEDCLRSRLVVVLLYIPRQRHVGHLLAAVAVREARREADDRRLALEVPLAFGLAEAGGLLRRQGPVHGGHDDHAQRARPGKAGEPSANPSVRGCVLDGANDEVGHKLAYCHGCVAKACRETLHLLGPLLPHCRPHQGRQRGPQGADCDGVPHAHQHEPWARRPAAVQAQRRLRNHHRAMAQATRAQLLRQRRAQEWREDRRGR
mmetsp:Transcript_30097/g.96064  ORF Transcript_30097/g.96064 Transcript_30097/m.96064 type:complete len:263 (+) Transcript_30097:121-909(+)